MKKNLNDFDNALSFLKKIRGGKITPEKAGKKCQNELNSYLTEIKRVKNKSNQPKRALYNT